MRFVISKPLLAGLLATTVTTAVVLLRPEADNETYAPESGLATAVDSTAGRGDPVTWERQVTAGKVDGEEFGLMVPVAPPPPPPVTVAPAPVVVAPPPVPTPSFSYLGRMVGDGKSFVFLQQGENVEIVAVGAELEGNWRLEKVSDAGLELRYLPSNEMRQLAISGK